MNDLDDGPPDSHAVAEAWQEFQQRMLTAVSPEGLSLAKPSFYFGALAVNAMLESVLGSGASAESLAFVLDGLRREIELVLGQTPPRIN